MLKFLHAVAGKLFHFTCFNVEDTDDPQVGLRNGDLTIPGNLLRQEVFDPVVHQVQHIIRFSQPAHLLTPVMLSGPRANRGTD